MNKLTLLVTALALTACASGHKKERPPEAAKVSIMTFNVENLFDDSDDENKNDETFLSPEEKSRPVVINKCRTQNSGRYMYECLEHDWSNKIIQRKLARIAAVVKQVNHGTGPDILILEEVENINILKRWRDNFLQSSNYQTVVLIEGPDERGIDTAVLSRLPQNGPAQLHLLDFTKAPDIKPEQIKQTRGILETRLELPNGDKLAVFAVHFPSQGAPTAFRREAMRELVRITSEVPKDTKVIVGGDFNITASEDWKHKYFREIAGEKFTPSHVIGCHSCPGSIYYPPDKTWSFFDVILFPKQLVNGEDAWQVDPDSIRLMNESVYQTNRFGTPARFGSGKASVGVSDHWPMYAEIKLRPSLEGVNQ